MAPYPGESSGRPGDLLNEIVEDAKRVFGGNKSQPRVEIAAGLGKPIPNDYYYTTEEDGEGAKENGYVFDRECGYVYLEPGEDRVPINRYHNPDGRHFYTDDAGGENVQAYGWNFDGMKFYICAKEHDEMMGYPWHRSKMPNGAYFFGVDGDRPEETFYQFERRLGYMWDYPWEETVPLYRWVRWPKGGL